MKIKFKMDSDQHWDENKTKPNIQFQFFHQIGFNCQCQKKTFFLPNIEGGLEQSVHWKFTLHLNVRAILIERFDYFETTSQAEVFF